MLLDFFVIKNCKAILVPVVGPHLSRIIFPPPTSIQWVEILVAPGLGVSLCQMKQHTVYEEAGLSCKMQAFSTTSYLAITIDLISLLGPFDPGYT